jgi:predicted nucleotidyltransferase
VTTTPRGPALDRVAAVAVELGDFVAQVVFIGGSIAPLLQTDPPFPEARVTTDVDGVAATSTYSDAHRLSEELVRRGFRQAIEDAAHIHRWIGPSGIPFDLVPAGEHWSGSGNPWDVIAIETAVEIRLTDDVTIRHVSAPAFLAQKFAAHCDRGAKDPLGSHDLEDILALLASRAHIADEVAAAPEILRAYVSEQTKTLLENPNVEDLLAAHLNNAQDPVQAIAAVRGLLERLARRR